MKRRMPYVTLILLMAVSTLVTSAGSKSAARKETGRAPKLARQQLQATYEKLPLGFEANKGQTDRQVQFLARGAGYQVFLTSSEAVLALRKSSDDNRQSARPSPADSRAVLRMKLVGANPTSEARAVEALAGMSNYFIGNDPAKWRTDVPSYGRVRYEAVYPGVDLVYYGNQRQLEYDFVVAAGADPSVIALDFAGADRRDLNEHGDLVLGIGTEQVSFHKPVIYQQADGQRREVAGGYVVGDRGQVSFQVAEYDHTQPLVIDPVLGYSTYLGGTGLDWGFAIAVDSVGDAYVTGQTTSTTDFPLVNAVDTSGDVSYDAFVTKFNPAASGGASLVYSTFLGGGPFMTDKGYGIAVDSGGNAYITGVTAANNFPVVNAFQSTHHGGVEDAFVSKLNSTGNGLLYSTYLGGSTGSDQGFAIAADSSGNAYVTGQTISGVLVGGVGIPFPTTANAYQATMGGNGFCCVMDAFVAKINTLSSGAASLVYSTYLGGTSEDQGLGIAADASGKVYVTGWTHSAGYFTKNAFQAAAASFQDAFVAKLDTTLSGAASLLYSTYLGGTDNEQGNAIAIDSLGNAYITGTTFSTNFPITLNAYDSSQNGGSDAFVAKLNPGVSGLPSLVYSTYLGGSSSDNGSAIAVDSSNYVYVTGGTSSSDFPMINAYDIALAGSSDAIVAKLDPALSGSASLIYSTYLGGSLPLGPGGTEQGNGIGVDAAGNAYVTGYTSSSDFPALNAYQGTFGGNYDVFVTKLVEAPPTPIADLWVTNIDSPDPVVTGSNLTYTIVVNNGGPDAATGVTLTDPLPGGVAFVSASSGCSQASGTVTCSIGTLANGGSANISIVVSPTTTGSKSNTVTVSSDANDPDPSNDSATATTTVNTPSADVSVTKSGSPDPVKPGGTVTYTILVTNNGPSVAHNVTLTDPINGVTLQSASGSCATVKAKGKTTVSCTIGTMASGASSPFSVVVVVPKKVGPSSNTATVSATEADPNTANNSATGSVTIAK